MLLPGCNCLSIKPMFVPIVEMSMILHFSYFPVSHPKNTEGVSSRSLKIKKIDKTLVSLLNCENKHVIRALVGFIASIDCFLEPCNPHLPSFCVIYIILFSLFWNH